MKQHKGLLALLLIFITLSIFYNMSIPLFEAPDETDHFGYIAWLKESKRLPQIYTDLNAAGHEIFQPPLYYVMLTPAIMAIDTSDRHSVTPTNEDWFSGAGINVHYHTKAESFPYKKTTLAVHVVRFLSSLLACMTIVCSYSIAKHIVPKQALLAAAIVALNPMFLFLSSVVNNDTLIIALCTLTLWWLVRLLFTPTTFYWQFIVLGLFWGAAVLSKSSGLALGGVIFLGVLMITWHYKTWVSLIMNYLSVLVGALLVSGWWFLRNTLLYNDPLAWKATMFANRGLARSVPLNLTELYAYTNGIWNSYWGSFGYGGLSAPPVFYTFIYIFIFFALIGLIIWIFRNMRQRPIPLQLAGVTLLISWNGLLFVSLLRWMSLLLATNRGRLLFPGIGAVAVLLALGFSVLTTLVKTKHNWFGFTFVAALGLVSLLSPFVLIQPAYAQPDTISDRTQIPNPVNANFGEDIELLGYSISQDNLTVGESLQVDLYWNTKNPLTDNYAIALHTLDASGEVISRMDVLPYDGRYATPVWQPNAPFKDSYIIPPIGESAIVGQGHIIVTLYPWGDHTNALPVSVDEIPVGSIYTLTPIKISPPEQKNYQPETNVNAFFDNKIELLGVDIPTTVTPGQAYPITLYWKSLQPDGKAYTVFVHLLDNEGNLVAQADGPPQENRFPTSIWETGEQIKDTHNLILPTDLQSTDYKVFVGLYDPNTGQRLTVVYADGMDSPENSIQIQTITLD